MLCPVDLFLLVLHRVPDVARASLTERSGSSTKGRTPNIRYFDAKLSVVAIYVLFEWLSQSFDQKPSCFRRAFIESHPVFVELSTKDILILSEMSKHTYNRETGFSNVHQLVTRLH